MAARYSILQNNHVIFQGALIDLKFKESVVIERSVKLFGDSDPCVIHRSYVQKVLVDEMKPFLPKQLKGTVILNQQPVAQKILDFDFSQPLTLVWEAQ